MLGHWKTWGKIGNIWAHRNKRDTLGNIGKQLRKQIKQPWETLEDIGKHWETIGTYLKTPSGNKGTHKKREALENIGKHSETIF